MTFSMRMIPKTDSTAYPFDHWAVSKTLDGGEDYLLARFEQYEDARALLWALRRCLEVRRGAQVRDGEFTTGRTF